MATVRAFLAMNFDIAVTRRIAETQAHLRDKLGAAGWKVSWVSPPNLHLTLKFFGDVAEEMAPAIEEAVRPLCERGPLRLAARGLGAFPDTNRPRVIWAGVEDPDHQLAQLVGRAEERLAEIGFAKEERAYHAHVTLGRVKAAGKEPLAALLPSVGAADHGESQLTELVLYQSDLRPGGAEYSSLFRVPFQRRAPKPESSSSRA